MSETTTPIELAADILQKSGVVAYPTETCWGLGVRADKPQAINRLLKLKESGTDKPVSILIYDQSWLDQLGVEINPAQQQLMNVFWPGPLTLLFKAKTTSKYLHLASPLIAVRCSSHPIAQKLVATANLPITSTSANLSGQAISKSGDKIKEIFADKDVFVLANLKSESPGSESTVLDVSGSDINVLREGDISLKKIKQALKG